MSTQYRITGSGASEIAAAVERGIRDGVLAPGGALPPVRRLAADLGLAVATVAAAYADLRRRGLVETGGRRGTRVRPRPATAPLRTDSLTIPPGALDLSSGEPDLTLLPPLGPVLTRLDPPSVGYADDAVLPSVRRLAAGRLAADGVPTEALTLCAGAADAIERCLATRVRPGDRVAVESPAWGNLLDLLAVLGVELVGMEVDDFGPLPSAVEAALDRGVSAMIVTSRAHNPTGASVSPERAATLRALLAGRDLMVIEDDHAAELAGVPLAPLAGCVASWAHVRSLSKPYGPDLRCALLAGDPVTVARVDGRRRLGPGWVSGLTQRVVASLWQSTEVDALVARAAVSYDARRGALLGALRERGVDARGRTGLNVWVPVADETAAVTVLRDAGIVVMPGSRYRVPGVARAGGGSSSTAGPAIRVTTSTLPVEDAAGVATAVAAAAATHQPAPRA
ncbi:aminotransferase class I/II-fold pyridoxal phosphate-dependent enzyme [Cryptosporangium sp. NPDC051539]|uniref:aminotransferase class I/II-fold pyridoxal phosphate-dependent enzyme n=1 Tax=Cryptosporangium sp. NPDC051539 TaxID=3363962 RepID=UPI0037AFB820